MSETTFPNSITPQELADFINTHFNESELRDLCFLLGIEYENLFGQSKSDKARELVTYFQRREQLEYLTNKVWELRPDTRRKLYKVPQNTKLVTFPEESRVDYTLAGFRKKPLTIIALFLLLNGTIFILVILKVFNVNIPPVTSRPTNDLTATRCESFTGPALSITIHDGTSSLPLTNFNIRYRIDDGDWIALPSPSTATVKIEGPSGKYILEVRKKGYSLHTEEVIVSSQENCEILQKNIQIALAQPQSCPNSPELIILHTVTEPTIQDNLSIEVDFPSEPPTRQQCYKAVCIVDLQAGELGKYIVNFVEFPNGIQNSIVYLTANNQTYEFELEGIENTDFVIPFDYGDSGCPEIIFDEVVAMRQDRQTTAAFIGEIILLRSYEIDPISSNVCKGAGNVTAVDHIVSLPEGTPISDVRVEYWINGSWTSAPCSLEAGRFVCSAFTPNPFFGDNYTVRYTINDDIFIGILIPLNNTCMIFK